MSRQSSRNREPLSLIWIAPALVAGVAVGFALWLTPAVRDRSAWVFTGLLASFLVAALSQTRRDRRQRTEAESDRRWLAVVDAYAVRQIARG